MLPHIAWRQAGPAHPQGLIAAPVGATYAQINKPDGTANQNRIRYFDKIGGGHSAFGWFPRVENANGSTLGYMGGRPGHTVFQGVNIANWQEDNWASTESGCASPFLLNRPVYAMYTPAAAGSSLLRCQLTGAHVVQRLDGSTPSTNLFLDWDLLVPILTGPTNFSLDSPPTMANTRLWVAALYSDAAQTAAGMVNNAALYSAFPTALPVNQGCRGMAIRFSNIDGDTGFVPIVARDTGGAASQTVGTSLVNPSGLTAVQAQTDYELRIRLARGLVNGDQIVAFSVNHGPEQILTATRSDAPGGSSYKALVIYVALTVNVATAKAIAVGPISCVAGVALNAGLTP